MHVLDWIIVIVYIIAMLALGVYLNKRATHSMEDYFLAGRKLPWWIIGFANVASYTGSSAVFVMFVFSNGLVGNWWWWAVWIVWMPMMTIFWAKIWRRLRIMTDAELLEVRYGGTFAKILRVTIATYICFFFCVIGMALVSTWLSTTASMVMGISATTLIIVFAAITFVYTLLSGLLGISYTDIPQFLIYILANLVFVPFCVMGAGGLVVMYETVIASRGVEYLNPIPPSENLPFLTLMAFLFQGFLTIAATSTAQRFAAAKNEFHAVAGQALSTVLSLVVRVFPLIIMGVAAAAIFPADYDEPAQLYGRMIVLFAPIGLIGLLVVAELSGYMSTMDTLMNYGSSLFTNDVYRRFLVRKAREKHYVLIGQIATALMTLLAVLIALFFVQATEGWVLYLNSVIGAFGLTAGVLRFTWWRFNKYGEFAGLFGAGPIGWIVWFTLDFQHAPFWQGFMMLALVGFAVMMTVTLLTPAEDNDRLVRFYARCLPFGVWGPIAAQVTLTEQQKKLKNYKADFLDAVLAIVFSACLVVGMNALIGLWFKLSAVCIVTFLVTGYLLVKRWQRRGFIASMNAEEPRVEMEPVR